MTRTPIFSAEYKRARFEETSEFLDLGFCAAADAADTFDGAGATMPRGGIDDAILAAIEFDERARAFTL